MGTRMWLAISLVWASSAVADMIQQDTTGCGQPNSSNMTCTYSAPSLFWLAPQGNAASSASWTRSSQGGTSLFTLGLGSPIINSEGTSVGNSKATPVGNFKATPVGNFKETPVGDLTADITGFEVQGSDDPQAFDLVYNLTAGGTTYRIDQPVEFVFRMGSDETSSGKPVFELQSSDLVPLAVFPKFDPPRARELPEQTVWSELLSISLGGAIIVGLAALCDRRILP